MCHIDILILGKPILHKWAINNNPLYDSAGAFLLNSILQESFYHFDKVFNVHFVFSSQRNFVLVWELVEDLEEKVLEAELDEHFLGGVGHAQELL